MLNLILAINRQILLLFFSFSAGCSMYHKVAYIKHIKPSFESDYKKESCFLNCSNEESILGNMDGFTRKCSLFDGLFPLKEKERIRMKKGIIVKKTYYSIFMGSLSGPVPYKVCYFIKAEEFKKDLSDSNTSDLQRSR